MRYIFCGNREISFQVLELLTLKGFYPLMLLLPENVDKVLARKLSKQSKLPEEKIIIGKFPKSETFFQSLSILNLDYVICIHYPYIIRKTLLDIPAVGVINLHPSYLPYNKGWHTPSWAILEKTLYGATLHFMTEKLDDGEIIHQKSIEVNLSDTADKLYQRVLNLEFEVFAEALADLLTLSPKRKNQIGTGTVHKKAELQQLQKLDMNKSYVLSELIDRIRSLTTNNHKEACYVSVDDRKYFVQIVIIEE